MTNEQSMLSLLDELSQLRAAMLREEGTWKERLNEVCDVHRESARNLVHYLALRRHDIRDLQERLAAIGLSSLGRAEANVLGAVDSVLFVLHRLAGKPDGEASPQDGTPFHRSGWDLLERNTDELLGRAPSDRNVRIMVTMPSEAARDFGLIRDLLLSGMNYMRVNCAHDGPQEWAAMIANLKRAQLEMGHNCRIHMDLGGPKLRTGPLQPGPAVVRYRPRRDAYGRVIAPARIFLTPARNPEAPTALADACLPAPATWLAKLGPGDRITFKDARGASRSMRVVDAEGKNRWAESDYTSYIIPGTVLEAVYAKSSPHGAGSCRHAWASFPRSPRRLFCDAVTRSSFFVPLCPTGPRSTISKAVC